MSVTLIAPIGFSTLLFFFKSMCTDHVLFIFVTTCMPHEWLIMHPVYALHVRISSYTHVWNHSCKQIGSWVEHEGKVDEGKGDNWRRMGIGKVRMVCPRPASVPWLSAARSLVLSTLNSQESALIIVHRKQKHLWPREIQRFCSCDDERYERLYWFDGLL